jgi:hypothetical protein
MKRSKKNSNKIITDEMADGMTVNQLYGLMKQGWELENPPVPDKQDKVDEKQSTFFASVGVKQGPTSPEENDPEMQQLANRLGVTPRDLLLFRELMLERYGDRYSEEDYPTPEDSEE